MLFDSNVWLALTFSAHPHRTLAKEIFSRASAAKPACFCRATQQSFLRLATTPAILKIYGAEGFTNQDAVNLLHALSQLPNTHRLAEPPDMEPLWLRLAGLSSASPKVWMDAYLAAFAILHKTEFITFDRDFQRYEQDGLKLKVLTP